MKHYVFQLCHNTQNGCILFSAYYFFFAFLILCLAQMRPQFSQGTNIQIKKTPWIGINSQLFKTLYMKNYQVRQISWMSLLLWIHANPYTKSGIIPLHGISTYSTFSLFAEYVPESQKLTQESSRWQYDHTIHNLSRSKSDHKSILYGSQYLTNYLFQTKI